MTWEVIPIIVVIALIIFILLFNIKKNSALKEQFDERQEMIRKKAYKYSAMTMMFTGLIYYFLCTLTERRFMEDGVSALLIALLGIGVFAIYSIFNDSFFSYRGQRGGLGQPGTYMILTGAVTLFNGIGAVGMIQEHELIKNGLLTSNVCQLALSILFLLILIALGIKHFMNVRENRGEDL